MKKNKRRLIIISVLMTVVLLIVRKLLLNKGKKKSETMYDDSTDLINDIDLEEPEKPDHDLTDIKSEIRESLVERHKKASEKISNSLDMIMSKEVIKTDNTDKLDKMLDEFDKMA